MNKKYDFVLFLCILLLLVIGAVMVYSATALLTMDTSAEAINFEVNNRYFYKQLVFVFIAVITLTFGMNIPVSAWQRNAKWLWLGSIVLLLLLPLFGTTVNGATRWFAFGPLRFNPGEIARVAMLVFLADLLSRKHEQRNDWKRGIAPALVVIYTLAFGLLLQKDFSSAFLLVATGLVVLFLSGVMIKRILLIVGINSLLAILLILFTPYRLQRLLSFLHGGAEAETGYQALQSLIALGNGGLTGVGLGGSNQKYFFLPEAHTDYIMAIVGEEWGFLGAIFVFLLFFLLFWRGVRISRRVETAYMRFLAMGITFPLHICGTFTYGSSQRFTTWHGSWLTICQLWWQCADQQCFAGKHITRPE
jgi:cell division protein FtsW